MYFIKYQKYNEKEFKNMEIKKKTTGRPSKEIIVKNYKNENPNATMYRCAKDLKLDYKTVLKWWKH